MLTQIDMKDWEKTCREKTGLGFETFKTVTHCDAETLDALLEAASGSIKGTMVFRLAHGVPLFGAERQKRRCKNRR